MKTTQKNHIQKTQLPVSKKFYAEIINRVTSSFSSTGNKYCREAINVIDNYIIENITPSTDCDSLILLMFNLLRPEIDKAIQRSRRARKSRAKQAAAKPIDTKTSSKAKSAIIPPAKNKRVASHLTPQPKLQTAAEETAEQNPQPFLNRRMRRLIEQEKKRYARKALRG